jgi:hypothetical protein
VETYPQWDVGSSLTGLHSLCQPSDQTQLEEKDSSRKAYRRKIRSMTKEEKHLHDIDMGHEEATPGECVHIAGECIPVEDLAEYEEMFQEHCQERTQHHTTIPTNENVEPPVQNGTSDAVPQSSMEITLVRNHFNVFQSNNPLISPIIVSGC